MCLHIHTIIQNCVIHCLKRRHIVVTLWINLNNHGRNRGREGAFNFRDTILTITDIMFIVYRRTNLAVLLCILICFTILFIKLLKVIFTYSAVLHFCSHLLKLLNCIFLSIYGMHFRSALQFLWKQLCKYLRCFPSCKNTQICVYINQIVWVLILTSGPEFTKLVQPDFQD